MVVSTEHRRILIIGDISYSPIKFFQNQLLVLAKGFVRTGQDARIFNYEGEIAKLCGFKSRTLSKLLYKKKVDQLLCDLCSNYEPDIIYTSFPRFLDWETLIKVRNTVPKTTLLGMDGDPWPKLQPGRIRTAKELDIVLATNDGQWLQDYRDAGVRLACFMPYCCDSDIEHRYEVDDKWKSNILWIGVLEHHADTSYALRRDLILKLAERPDAAMYGPLGRPRITGKDALYAMSGAKIGLSVNAYEPVRLAHSNRLTRLLANGTFVLSNRFPGCESLYKDGEHLKYFDTADEFFELVDWYIEHDNERKRIADAGMKWMHEQFNCVKIAGYILDLVDKGSYTAPWSR